MSSSSPSDRAHQLDRALTRCGLADRSDLGRLFATGPDLLDLLHRLSTGDVRELAVGEGRPTVVTTPKGRIIERLFVHRFADGVLMVAGAGGAARVREHLDKFTFAEKTGLADITGETVHLGLIGPASREAAVAAGIPEIPEHGAIECEVSGTTVRVVGEDGFSKEGVSVIVPGDGAAAVREALSTAVREAGGSTVDAEVAEAWRVLSGLPASGRELTEDQNPLEAGLRDAVSFSKGCYVGQEVVARLNTYDKVSRDLVGLSFPEGAEVPDAGSRLFFEGHEVGAVTSAVLPPGRGGPVALAYVKRREAGAPGSLLRVGGAGSERTATRVALPFDPA